MPFIQNALVRLVIPDLDPDNDAVSFNFAYRSIAVGGVPSDTEFLVDNVHNFINTVGAGASAAMSTYMAASLDGGTNHATTEVYDVSAHLAGTPHGSPVDSGTWTYNNPGAGSLPGGLAACISFRADYGTDVEFAPGARPRARDRGRVYVGPLNGTTITSPGPTFRSVFKPQFITDCLNNLHQILVVNSTEVDDPISSWGLSVWSRKNSSMKGISEFFMDDRPDYQRRRSDPGTKTFLPA